jgi:hypothetical protein
MHIHMLKIFTLLLLLLSSPLVVQAETGWTVYKPGLVESTIAKGGTVVLGYLSSW